jgi:hypothetical protein
MDSYLIRIGRDGTHYRNDEIGAVARSDSIHEAVWFLNEIRVPAALCGGLKQRNAECLSTTGAHNEPL